MTGVGAVLNRAKVETRLDDGRLRPRRHRAQLRAGRRARRRREDHRGRRRCRRSSRCAPQFGATHVIDADDDGPGRGDHAISPRGGADYTFECVGNVAVIQQALDALGPGGALTIVGVPKIGYELRVRRARALPEQGDPRLPLRHGAAAAGLPDARRPLPHRPPQDRRADHRATTRSTSSPRRSTTCSAASSRAASSTSVPREWKEHSHGQSSARISS